MGKTFAFPSDAMRGFRVRGSALNHKARSLSQCQPYYIRFVNLGTLATEHKSSLTR